MRPVQGRLNSPLIGHTPHELVRALDARPSTRGWQAIPIFGESGDQGGSLTRRMGNSMGDTRCGMGIGDYSAQQACVWDSSTLLPVARQLPRFSVFHHRLRIAAASQGGPIDSMADLSKRTQSPRIFICKHTEHAVPTYKLRRRSLQI